MRPRFGLLLLAVLLTATAGLGQGLPPPPEAKVTAGASGNPPMAGAVSCSGEWANCNAIKSARIDLVIVTLDPLGKEVETGFSNTWTNTTSASGTLTLNAALLTKGTKVRAKITVRDGPNATGILIASGTSNDFIIP